MRTWIDRGLALAAILLAASLTAAALHDASRAWDTWYYHLPFAARLAGVVPASEYVFGAGNEARFAGFPLLAEALQGALWRLTGRAEAANLVALGSLAAFVAFARARLGLSPHGVFLALFAIPLVHVHATACYVDLPANLALAALVVVVVQAWAAPAEERVSWRALAWAVGAACVAVNTKTLAQPVAFLALVALAVRARRTLTASPRAVAVTALALALVFATPLKNAAVHHNPWFPLKVSVLGAELPGTETPYASSPPSLEGSSRPARFVASLLELGVRPLSDRRRWTVDQWTPPDAPGYRMGGFFGAYVLAEIAVFSWLVATGWRASRRARAAAVGFFLLTTVTAVSPQSHELRYYMDWMIVLVTLVAWLAPERARLPLFLLSATALVAVLAVTRAGYAYPSGSTFAEIVAEQVDERAVLALHDGESLCVLRQPYDVVWARAFHAGARAYVVKEGEQPSDCEGQAKVTR